MSTILHLILCLAVVLLIPACTIAAGNRAKGTYAYASLGGNAYGLSQTPEGVAMQQNDNATSFRTAVKTAGTVAAVENLSAALVKGNEALQSGMTARAAQP